MKKRVLMYFVSLVLVLAVFGCASYYRIADPVTKKVYYTKSIDKKSNGAIQFKDENSRSSVTLAESEVLEITEDQYKADTHSKE